MVSDTRFTRVFRAGGVVFAMGALVLACAPFGESRGDAPPVDDGRSDGLTGPSHDGGATGDAKLESSDGAAIPTASASVCNGNASCERVVFVTSVAVPGWSIQGMVGADAICNQLAAASTHPRVAGRKFVAWLSDDTRSPSTSMVRGTKGYVRPDGARIAADYAQLTGGGALEMPIEIDEDGQPRQGEVWSATSPAGEREGEACYGWSSPTAVGAQGAITATAARWTRTSGSGSGDGQPQDCFETSNRLYCFEK